MTSTPTPEQALATLKAADLEKALALERRLTRLETTQYILLAAIVAIGVRVYFPG